MDVPRKTIVVNKLLLSYKHFVPSNNAGTNMVLFLHGWGSELNVWNKIATELSSEGYECISLDLPGFGLSQKPESAMTITDFTMIITQFIKKLELNNIVLVGHSFGGAVSIKLAALNLSVLRKMVLVDSSGIRLKREKMTLVALSAKIVKPIFAPSFMQPFRRKIYKLIGNKDYLDSGDMKETYLNIIEEDLTPLFSNISIPTLIIWGDKDNDTPLWMGKKIFTEIKNSKFVVLEGTGHYSFLEKPKEFKSNLNQFLQQ